VPDPVCAITDCGNPLDPEGWVEVTIDADGLEDGQTGPVLARLGICTWHDQAIGNSPGVAFTLKALVDEAVEC
jgi:hypothetical protein